MGIQNFFFVPCCWKNKNHLSLKITLFICALITKGNVTFSLKKDLKSILFQLYFIITLYESLLVFFFWSRNEWSNVGLLLSKNIHLIVSQDFLKEKISPVFKVLHMNHLNYHFNPENITLPFWYYQCYTCGTDSLLKLMEGNLHCTGKVARFCHHIGIVKEHQLFRPSTPIISRIWEETITPNIQ